MLGSMSTIPPSYVRFFVQHKNFWAMLTNVVLYVCFNVRFFEAGSFKSS